MTSTRKPTAAPPEAPAPDPLASTPYRSIRYIGSGSMGDVIEAEHHELRKRVVVKLFSLKVFEAYSVAAMEDRFRLEAQALASLDGHANIVQVSDCGRTREGQLYLVMQKLDGRTLDEELALRGPFAPAPAVRLVSQVLAGLEVVHAAGLVHRDIKPSNLFLCDPPPKSRERVLKILDFGIVKLLAAEGSGSRPTPLAVPTAEGAVLGSPRYVAPEQALGQRVDGRADLYAVGAVLYTLLTGKDPFHDESGVYEVLAAHISRVPAPPSSLAPSRIPPRLDAAILKVLAKRPEDRFASAREFHEALARSVVVPVPRWPATERLDTSAFRNAVLAASPNGGPRDADAEVTLRFTAGEVSMPVLARAVATRADGDQARRVRVRVAVAAGALVLLAVVAGLVCMMLAAHAAGIVR